MRLRSSGWIIVNRTIRMKRRNLGLVLSLMSVGLCALLHVATFITAVPFQLLLVSFALLGGAILCERRVRGAPYRSNSHRIWVSGPARKEALVGFALLVYAVILFVLLYSATGGASGVGMVDGQYDYLSKGHVIRSITEQEFRMFPTQVVRIMSVWLGMMATFCHSSLRSSSVEPDAVLD
jgi:hypothetical protein